MLDNLNLTEDQKEVYLKMKSYGIDVDNISEKILLYDITEMLRYAKLGQEYDSAIRHYNVCSGNVSLYLGALYVGVEPENELLISYLQHGIDMEYLTKIDYLKLRHAYKYLFHANSTKPMKVLLSALWSVVENDMSSLITMSDEELHFWWELIPMESYKDTGSTMSDIEEYLIH